MYSLLLFCLGTPVRRTTALAARPPRTSTSTSYVSNLSPAQKEILVAFIFGETCAFIYLSSGQQGRHFFLFLSLVLVQWRVCAYNKERGKSVTISSSFLFLLRYSRVIHCTDMILPLSLSLSRAPGNFFPFGPKI